MFRRAGFDDLRQAFAGVAGQDLRPEFNQWLTRAGAPAVQLSRVTARPDGQDYVLTASIEQVQPGPAYQLHLPLAVSMAGQEQAYQTTAVMADKHLELALRLPARPLRLDVDPEFDVFRRLHRDEGPPALTQMFGAETALLLLPTAASAAVRQGCAQLARLWQGTLPVALEIRSDSEVGQVPADRAVWLCGWTNRFRPLLNVALADYAVTITDVHVRFAHTVLARDQHTVVLVARHPAHPHLSLAWIAAENVAAMLGVARKLPHYGRYSYLGFAGDEPVNIMQGEWPIVHSPLSVSLPQADGTVTREALARLAPRHSLVAPPPGLLPAGPRAR
jgi:hypothetical protein